MKLPTNIFMHSCCNDGKIFSTDACVASPLLNIMRCTYRLYLCTKCRQFVRAQPSKDRLWACFTAFLVTYFYDLFFSIQIVCYYFKLIK